MQIKIFTIPIVGGEQLNDEMNVFLRSKKIVQVESQIVTLQQSAFWSFCIKYVEEIVGNSPNERGKVDYNFYIQP